MFTHEIDFFSNRTKVEIQSGIIVKADDNGFAPCCGGCNENIVGYWIAFGKRDGTLEVMCPSDGCGTWPLKELK